MPLPTINNVDRPRLRGYHAQLDDLYLRLAEAPDRQTEISTAQPAADRINTSQLPEEFTPEFGDVFSRSEFSGGEGLDRAHQRVPPPNHTARYFDSKGVKIHHAEGGRRHEIGLLEDTALSDNLSATSIGLLWTGSRLYATNGTQLRVSTDPLAAGVTWADEDPHAGEAATTVERIAHGGSTVYAALGTNGIHRRIGGAWEHWSDLEADGVWWVNNRIMASKGNEIHEVTSDGVAGIVTTFPPDVQVTDVVGAQRAILVSANDGYVYAISLNEESALALQAQTRFEHEEPMCLGFTQGLAFIGTSQGSTQRLWRASVRDDGILTDRRVLREWRDTVPLRHIASTRESVFTAVAEGDRVDAWEYNVTQGGVYRSWSFEALGAARETWGLVLVEDRFFAGIDNEGVYRTADEYVAEGYLIGPLGDFYTSSMKDWATARLMAQVDTGQFVRLEFTTDPRALSDPAHSSWVRAIDATGGMNFERPLSKVVSRSLAGMVRLRPDPPRVADPRVRSFAFRAFLEASELLVRLPINVSDEVAPRGRQAVRAPRLGERMWQELQVRSGHPAQLHLFRPALTLRGYVRNVETPILARTNRGSLTWVSMLTLQGTRIGQSSVVHAAGPIGTATIGLLPTLGTVAEAGFGKEVE